MRWDTKHVLWMGIFITFVAFHTKKSVPGNKCITCLSKPLQKTRKDRRTNRRHGDTKWPTANKCTQNSDFAEFTNSLYTICWQIRGQGLDWPADHWLNKRLKSLWQQSSLPTATSDNSDMIHTSVIGNTCDTCGVKLTYTGCLYVNIKVLTDRPCAGETKKKKLHELFLLQLCQTWCKHVHFALIPSLIPNS